jgi:hypothetical protein
MQGFLVNCWYYHITKQVVTYHMIVIVSDSCWLLSVEKLLVKTVAQLWNFGIYVHFLFWKWFVLKVSKDVTLFCMIMTLDDSEICLPYLAATRSDLQAEVICHGCYINVHETESTICCQFNSIIDVSEVWLHITNYN